MPKDILEIFRDLGFRPYQELPGPIQREIGAANYGATFDIFKRLWRKLDTGKWDFVEVPTTQERQPNERFT